MSLSSEYFKNICHSPIEVLGFFFVVGIKVPRARSRTMPCIPRSLIFDIPDNFSFTSSDEKFIFYDRLYSNRTKRIIAFASPLQLRKLFSSPLICLDGTFSIVPKCYKQLLIIQSIDANNYEGKQTSIFFLH